MNSIRPFKFTERGDRIGWVKGIDNNWHLTLFIESGRLVDNDEKKLLSGVLEIAKIHKGDFRYHRQPKSDRGKCSGRG